MSRTQRDYQTRESQARTQHWRPPSHLRMPDPPPGWHYAFKRYLLDGKEDTKNLMSAFEQGYVPVTAKDLPAGYQVQTLRDGDNAGAVVVGDLMLMKISVEAYRERTDYYRQRTRRQEKAINHELMKRSTSAMPITDDSRELSTLGARPKPEFLEEE